nr:hypothetical protein [Acinetobacter oleivorans]
MDGQSAAKLLLRQIQVLEDTQHDIESQLSHGDKKNEDRLANINDSIGNLRKTYDYTVIINLGIIKKKLEDSINNLKSYNDALNNEVAEIAKVSQIIKFLANAIFVASGL